MANPTLTNLFPDIYAAMSVVSRELVGFTPAVTMSASAARAAKDQNIRIPLSVAGTPENITPASTVPSTGSQTMAPVTMTLNKMRAVPFIWEGETERGADSGIGMLSIQQLQIAEAIRALINEIEADVAAEYVDASRAFGTAGTTPFASDLSAAAELQKILDDNGAPQGDRQLVIDTSAFVNLSKLAQLTDVSKAGEVDLLRRGVLTDLFGFSVRKSAQVKLHTKGTGTGYLVNDATPPGIGETSITTDTGTGTIVEGDVVTLAGDTNKYVAAQAHASNTLVINTPGLRVAADDNDAITVGADYRANLAFSRSAMLLAVRPPAIPKGGDLASDRRIVTDPNSGLSLEFAVFPGYYQVRYEVAAVWGAKAIKPDHIALLLG